QSRETRETVGRRYFGDPCLEKGTNEAHRHHAGNHGSCSYESLKSKLLFFYKTILVELTGQL
ncbi:uncharacterized protein METZ01_LOCUS202309, partial [marine metagenome]